MDADISVRRRGKNIVEREMEGGREGRQLSFAGASGFTSEIQQSLMRMRRVRKGDWEMRDQEGEKTSDPNGRLGKNQVVFTPIC